MKECAKECCCVGWVFWSLGLAGVVTIALSLATISCNHHGVDGYPCYVLDSATGERIGLGPLIVALIVFSSLTGILLVATFVLCFSGAGDVISGQPPRP